LRKLSEEVGLNRVLKEPVLSLLAVVVHAVSQDGKIKIIFLSGLHQEKVVLVVSMGIHESHHALNQHTGLFFVQIAQNRSVSLSHKPCNDLVHSVSWDQGQIRLGKLRFGVEITLVFGLVVLVHCSEAGSQEKEIKLLNFLIFDDAGADLCLNRFLVTSRVGLFNCCRLIRFLVLGHNSARHWHDNLLLRFFRILLNLSLVRLQSGTLLRFGLEFLNILFPIDFSLLSWSDGGIHSKGGLIQALLALVIRYHL